MPICRALSAHGVQIAPRARPELVAEGPDKVWTWDITKLKTPWKGSYFDLYVMLDIFSRKAIHWEVHNLYSEARFKTLKYCPVFPGSFTTIGGARAFCVIFFDYYNNEHRHSGIGPHTPASVHDGTARKIREHRQEILDAAYAAHPERFRSRPVAPKLPERAWINKPRPTIVTQEVTQINQAA